MYSTDKYKVRLFRFLIILGSFILTLLGVVLKNDIVLISGSICFMIYGIIGIIDLIVTLKKHKHKTPIESLPKTLISKTSSILEGIVLFGGLIMMMVGHKNKGYEGLELAGIIIWGGSILLYFLSGIIVENITKIPLEFGHGGWKIKRFRRGRRK